MTVKFVAFLAGAEHFPKTVVAEASCLVASRKVNMPRTSAEAVGFAASALPYTKLLLPAKCG